MIVSLAVHCWKFRTRSLVRGLFEEQVQAVGKQLIASQSFSRRAHLAREEARGVQQNL